MKLTVANINKVIVLYQTKKTINAVSNYMKVDKKLVYKVLQDNNIQILEHSPLDNGFVKIRGFDNWFEKRTNLQNLCPHDHYHVVCSHCSKILGSENRFLDSGHINGEE